ncbi:hypothetical protein ACDX78_02875 [Virgibacillus oceani]
MGRKWVYFLSILCTALVLLVFLYPQSASAHRMLIEHEEGVIHIRYDDGTSAALALITAYDEEGDTLFEREADDDGTLNYDGELNVHRIAADDGMGHRATWTTDEEKASMLDDIPLFVRAIFGISILLFIAAIFVLRNHRKSEEGEKN